MSGFQPPISIYEAIRRIDEKEYLLPAFQREFEWDVDRITKLFDSLMKGYPINSMLFWKVKGETKNAFKFYSVLDKYIEYHHIHNDAIKTDRLNDFYAILDGQQRLTSIYISMCGSYAYHEYRKSWDYSESSFPTRHMYLCLSRNTDLETEEEFYDFQFFTKSDTQEKDLFIDEDKSVWFRAGKILDLSDSEKYTLDDFIDDNKLTKLNKDIIRKFRRLVYDGRVINFYEEDEQKADKAVNIFVRINSGGISLTFSDILMSIAVANWQKEDARTEIHNLVDCIQSKGFSISKDYVLKAFLFLYHKDVKFQIHNFNNGFMLEIEKNWKQIRDAIISLFETLKTFGLNSYTLTSNNATLPILYYIYHRGIWDGFAKRTVYRQDREIIKNWLFTVLLRRTFGSQSDTVLNQARKVFTDDIQKMKIPTLTEFPSIAINKGIKKFSDLTDDIIEELLTTQKDSQYSFPILAMLYPNLDYKNNDFHQDHTHPAAHYDNLDPNTEISWETYNSIVNLQMLDANENMSKNDMPLKDWIDSQTDKQHRKQFLENHLIPDVDLSFDNIQEYFEERKRILIKKLKTVLN